jgi:predicted ArsR family transcriptional regulator
MQGLLQRIMEVLSEEGPLTPGDVVVRLGAPRYRVLAAFHCLEELGLAAPIYSRGSTRIYTLTTTGRAALKIASEEGGLASVVQRILEVPPEPAGVAAPKSEGVA